MAGEEEVILGSNSEGITHESGSVNDQNTGHGAGDTARRDKD